MRERTEKSGGWCSNCGGDWDEAHKQNWRCPRSGARRGTRIDAPLCRYVRTSDEGTSYCTLAERGREDAPTRKDGGTDEHRASGASTSSNAETLERMRVCGEAADTIASLIERVEELEAERLDPHGFSLWHRRTKQKDGTIGPPQQTWRERCHLVEEMLETAEARLAAAEKVIADVPLDIIRRILDDQGADHAV